MTDDIAALVERIHSGGEDPYKLCGQAADALERLEKELAEAKRDAERYRYLRNGFFTRELADEHLPPEFTGSVIIAPPRSETFDHGASIMTNAAHSEHLDAVIDAALRAQAIQDAATRPRAALEGKP